MKYTNAFLMLIAIFSLSLFYSCDNSNPSDRENHATTTVVDEHNSKNALDWAGTYAGTLPCASCPGIKTTIVLKANNAFERTMEYLEEETAPVVDKGTVSWSSDGTRIKVEGQTYVVGEGKLIQLDRDGNMISGELADNYVLRKVN